MSNHSHFQVLHDGKLGGQWFDPPGGVGGGGQT